MLRILRIYAHQSAPQAYYAGAEYVTDITCAPRKKVRGAPLFYVKNIFFFLLLHCGIDGILRNRRSLEEDCRIQLFELACAVGSFEIRPAYRGGCIALVYAQSARVACERAAEY